VGQPGQHEHQLRGPADLRQELAHVGGDPRHPRQAPRLGLRSTPPADGPPRSTVTRGSAPGPAGGGRTRCRERRRVRRGRRSRAGATSPSASGPRTGSSRDGS
jgi:hypothetical protein